MWGNCSGLATMEIMKAVREFFFSLQKHQCLKACCVLHDGPHKDLSPRSCPCDLMWQNHLCRCNSGTSFERRPSWITLMDPNPMTSAFIRHRRETHREEGHVNMEAEIRVIGIPCSPSQGIPADTRNGGSMGGFPWSLWRD